MHYPLTIENALKIQDRWPIKPQSMWLPRWHWTEVVIENYLNAKAMCELMDRENADNLKKLLGARKNGGSAFIEQDEDRKMRACGMAFYFFARTALKAAASLCENASRNTISDNATEKLYTHRKKHKPWAFSLIQIRNVIVTHQDDLQKAPTIISWTSSGEITAHVRALTWKIEKEKEYKLNPRKDLKALHDYLNGLFPLIDKCYKKNIK